MQDKTNKLAKNTIVFVIGSLGSKFIQFFLVPFYTYSMSTAEFGSADIILTMANVLVPVFSLSISDGLLRFGLDKKLKQSNVLRCCFVIANIGTAISLMCIPLFRLYSGISRWIFEFILIMTLQVYRGFFSINLKIEDKNRLYAIDSILYTFVLCVSSIILLSTFKLGIIGYLMSYVIANIISILFLCIVGKPLAKIGSGHLDRQLFLSIVRYSIPMVANAMAWWIITASDRIMIQYFIGNAAVGLYAVADKIPNIISNFSGVFIQAWAISSITEYDSDRDSLFYQKVFDKYYSSMLFAATILIAVVKIFMHYYVSPSFESAWVFTPVLISAAVYCGIFSFYGVIYASAKDCINATITTVIGATINVALNLILIPKFEIQGAAVATYASWMITSFIRIKDTRKYINFKINFTKFISMIAINLLHCICVVALPSKISLLISCTVIILMYIINRDIVNHLRTMMFDKIRKAIHHSNLSR